MKRIISIGYQISFFFAKIINMKKDKIEVSNGLARSLVVAIDNIVQNQDLFNGNTKLVDKAYQWYLHYLMVDLVEQSVFTANTVKLKVNKTELCLFIHLLTYVSGSDYFDDRENVEIIELVSLHHPKLV